MDYPKVELHVHLEGTVQPRTLLELARRNRVGLPADSVEGLTELYRFTDFAHFIEVWVTTTNVMRTADDFRRITLEYAAEAARHRAVYLEAIFSPIERVARGVGWEEIFEGYCDGAQQAAEQYGVVVRLTPDAYRGAPVAAVEQMAHYAVKYQERGVVGIGLGGAEHVTPAALYAKAFALARDGGLGAVPHAGETAGPASIRETLEALGAGRIRHGIRAIEDPGLVAELVQREVVLDVCLTSNLRTKVVSDIGDHPLPELLTAGVACTLGTDDPAMFGTDLGREHEIARSLGVQPKDLYDAGVRGALCDAAAKERLRAIGDDTEWP